MHGTILYSIACQKNWVISESFSSSTHILAGSQVKLLPSTPFHFYCCCLLDYWNEIWIGLSSFPLNAIPSCIVVRVIILKFYQIMSAIWFKILLQLLLYNIIKFRNQNSSVDKYNLCPLSAFFSSPLFQLCVLVFNMSLLCYMFFSVCNIIYSLSYCERYIYSSCFLNIIFLPW